MAWCILCEWLQRDNRLLKFLLPYPTSQLDAAAQTDYRIETFGLCESSFSTSCPAREKLYRGGGQSQHIYFYK